MKNILMVSYAYIAALIGAGFASGQEILCYFTKFGGAGFYGIIAASVIFALFAYSVLGMCIATKSYDFEAFLRFVPKGSMRGLLKTCTGVFAFAVYIVMLAATGEICYVIAGIPQKYGALAAALLCPLIFCSGTDKVFELNGIIGLVLIVGISACCIYMLRYREMHTSLESVRALGSAGIYSGYNLITMTPVLAVLSRRLRSRQEAAAVSVVSGIVLFFLMSVIFALLAIYAGRINLGEFPMLTLAFRQNRMFALLYGAMLAGAVITTLLSAGSSMIETFMLKKRPSGIFIMSALAYVFSGMGFSRLIDTAYRICGTAGFIICVYIVFVCICVHRIGENREFK